jgi:tetratricopeptide (TPR) repeat protein
MTDNFNNDAIQATAALAGATVVAAGVWKIFEQASDTFKSFITSKDKADAQNLYEKALQYQQQGIHNEAIRLFQEALKKDPTHSDAYNGIAWFYAINNTSLGEAEWYAHSAIKFAYDVSSRSAAIDTLAEIYLRQNKIQQAIVTFQNCLLIQKKLDSYYRLSWCYQLTQNILEAYNCLIEAVNLQQIYFLDIYQRLGTVCLELGRYTGQTHLNFMLTEYGILEDSS